MIKSIINKVKIQKKDEKESKGCLNGVAEGEVDDGVVAEDRDAEDGADRVVEDRRGKSLK